MDTHSHPLKEYRKRLGLTLAQLAERVETTKGTISRIETGEQKPRPDLVRRIHQETGIAPAVLRPDLAELMRTTEAAE